MLVALIITLASVLAGAGLAALTSRGSVLLGALRTFAVAAVVCGVMVQLLPEAVEDLGGWALVIFIVALAFPALIASGASRLLSRRNGGVSPRAVGIELGYLGFAAHQFAEGLALGTYAGPAHDGHHHADLVLAVAAHTVPLTAVFIAIALSNRGPRAALIRTGGLVAATTLGFAAAEWMHQGFTQTFHSWGSAAVAGFLCHVLLHDPGVQPRRTSMVGVLDVVAATTGIALPILAVDGGAGPGAAQVRSAVGTAFIELAIETAPMLLLGLVLGALLQVLGTRIPGRWLRAGSASRQALRGIAVGAPLPLCACGVLPIAEALRKRGAGPALVMAFLIATPELGPETLTLTVRFLGWPFALVRLGAALLLAYVVGLLFARLVRDRRSERTDDSARSVIMPMPTSESSHTWRAALGYFDELVLHTAPWTFVGLLVAAYVQAAIPAESLEPLARTGLDIIVVGLVAMPTYVCAASATPLAAVLLLKGISPGAVLVGLLLGPATNVATLAVMRRGYGTRPVLLGAVAIVGCSFALGWLVNVAGISATVLEDLSADHEHGLVAVASMVVLGLVLARQLWRWGTGPWFQILDAGGSGHGHGHGHEHHPPPHEQDHVHQT